MRELDNNVTDTRTHRHSLVWLRMIILLSALVNRAVVRKLKSTCILVIPVFTTLSADLKGVWLWCYKSWICKLANILIYLCGFYTDCSRICGLWPQFRTSFSIGFVFYEQLDRNIEGLKIMSARALSDAATQYCEVVELTNLIEKYELQ